MENSSKSKKRLHVIANSHIDPVWLWRRSSGRTSWLNTVRSVVRIMDEQPDIKFTCSSAALYRWIDETDPGLFKRLQELVREQRWEIVGGWEVQSDAIICRPETLVRQAAYGKQYLQDRFGVDVRIGYCVDSFGHSAGLPGILRNSGMEYYVFTRPFALKELLFDWRGADGASVTALHIFPGYGMPSTMSREDLFQRIELLQGTELPEQTFFFGLGDHGGGLSRRHLAWLREAMGEYDIVFSTLTEYFEAVRDYPLPTVTGELTPDFRGCYSAGHEVKSKVAISTRQLLKAEKLSPDPAELDDAWLELLFNHFHDILPGTSTREAFEHDVYPGLGMVEFTANNVLDRELCRRGVQMDTSFMTEGGVLVWNHHPFKANAIVSFDGFTDPNASGELFNVLRSPDGSVIPLQILPPDTGFGPYAEPWGKLTALIGLDADAIGLYAYGRDQQERPALGFECQRALLEKLSFELFYDDTRTWGFGLASFVQVIGTATQTGVREYADGPVCSILRATYEWRGSGIVLDLVQYVGIDEIELRVRLDWHDVNCCLKLAVAHGLKLPEFRTNSCGAVVQRPLHQSAARQWNDGRSEPLPPNSGECSMVDWCMASAGEHNCGFLAGDLHSCDHADNKLRMTLNRPVFYADHEPFTPNRDSGYLDVGMSWRKLWYFDLSGVEHDDLHRLAAERLDPAECREMTAR